MIFIYKLKLFFGMVLIISSFLLGYLWFDEYKFNNSPISKSTKQKILQKENRLKLLTKNYFSVVPNFPIIISDKLDNKLFGLATYNEKQEIKIYLNKNHFYESEDYMINDVLPHEYAHALMFIFDDFSNINGGHTKKWQEICKKLQGLRCERFVNHKDILIGKTKIY